MISKEKFIKTTLGLINEEREAEIEETRLLQENVSPKELQRRGVCLLKLRISSRHTGLYGRTVLVFEHSWPGKELPSHNFTPGDIAGVYPSQSDSQSDALGSGVVSKVTQASVSVAFEETPDQLETDEDGPYRLAKLANDVTYRRLKKGLQALDGYRTGPSGGLISVLFGECEPGPPYSPARDGKAHDLEFINPNLDESQQEATKFALNQRELAIIHGPPGTGKTTTVVEIILQAIRQKLKILACAPSNIAVDNLVERLANHKARVVRLGHPARLLPAIQKYSLDALLAGSDETKLVQDVRKDIDKTLFQIRKTRDKGEKHRLKQDVRYLRKELRQREETATREILKNSQVVLATLTTATYEGPLKMLDEEHFDLVIIDECSQALEAACWIALLRGSRCILAGDHNQLPPTIISHKAAKAGLEVTLMERLLKHYGATVMRMLTVQYRMHHAIMEWSSQQLYDGKLTAHSSVAHHLLRDVAGIASTEDTTIPVLLIDTAGCDLWELSLPDEVSKGNEGEADLVTYHVEQLIASGLGPGDIAVIAPYNLQVELLRVRLSQRFPKLEIKSVDGFQGREKEAVVISLVRSNDRGEVGFLAENRRINVAITRARRHLAVVCDSETVGRHKFLKDLVEYMTEHGEVRSAQQLIEEGALKNYERPEFLETKLQQMPAAQAKPQKNEKATSKKTARPAVTKKNVAQKKTQPTPGSSEMKSHVPGIATVDESPEAEMPSLLTSEEIEDQLQHYLKMKDGSKEYRFPTTLTSKERYLVHEVAEKLGLLHLSQGEGRERHIVVKHPVENKAAEAKNQQTAPLQKPSGLGAQNALRDPNKNVTKGDSKESLQVKSDHKIVPSETAENINKEQSCSFKPCDKCGKDIPVGNLELHTLRCGSAKLAGDSGLESKSKKKKKPKSVKKENAKDDPEEDFDSLIANAIKENTSCHISKCKNNAATLGQNCPFCAKRFCLTHFIAEAHGCGDLARQQARAVINREGQLYQGSGVPNKKPNPQKRAQLERKLDSKLTDLAGKRKPKKKE